MAPSAVDPGNPRIERLLAERRQPRPHRASVLLMVIVIAASVVAFFFTASARDDDEARLLDSRADQMGQFVQRLAGQLQGSLASAAIVAEHTNGDLASFASIARSSTPADQDVVGWALLDQVNGVPHVITSLGRPADQLAMTTWRTPATDARLKAAFTGKFEVLGLLGTGMARRIVTAAGAPGTGQRYVAYHEISLVRAAEADANSMPRDTGGTDSLGAVGLALAADNGTRPADLIFNVGRPKGDTAVRTVEIGNQPITYVVWARHRLLGGAATNLPMICFVFLLVAGCILAVVIESNLRRRDRAVDLVDELDAAMVHRDRSDRERKELEVQLRQAQRLEAVGELAGGVAHDFNNLLAAIMGYADLLSDDLRDHPSHPDVDQIRNAARRGATLTRQLLQFGSRATASPEVSDSLDLNAAIGDLKSVLAGAVGEEIRLRIELADGLAPVLVARSDLEQILMNLVLNARDAIDGTGTITVTTDIGDGQAVRLTVSDNGCGMDDETVGRIFDPFFTTRDRGRGTGLGLATVYGIVTRAGGEIRVSSTPGEGSVFEVTLPLAGGPPATSHPDAEAATGGRCGQVVLLVDDDGAVRRPTRRMLERAGYRVVEARDGQRAVQAFPAAPVDLLLTDVTMPGGLSGKDVAGHLREQRPELPVIFMSGHGADLLARQGVGDAVLEKPFNEDELLAVVAAALEPSAPTRPV